MYGGDLLGLAGEAGLGGGQGCLQAGLHRPLSQEGRHQVRCIRLALLPISLFYLYFPGPHLAFIVVVFCHYPQFRQGLIHIQYRYRAGTVLDEVKRSPLFCMAVLRYRI